MIKLIILPILLLSIFLGSTLYENQPNLDIYNKTENTFVWNESNFKIYTINNTNDYQEIRIRNSINKLVNAFGFITFEIFKFGTEYGFNKKIDYKDVKFLVIIIIILAFIKPLLILLLIIYFLSKSTIGYFKKNDK